MSEKIKNRLKVKSLYSGFTFNGDLSKLQEVASLLQSNLEAENKTTLQESLRFWLSLLKQEKEISPHYITINKKTFYRGTIGNLSPLNIAGNLADGGRFNIGGAQNVYASKVFNIRKQACIYCANSISTVKKEIGQPIPQNISFFKIAIKESLKFIDLKKIITQLNYPNLKNYLDQTPFDAAWGMQQVPTISQLLMSYLRNRFNDANGAIYPSTKDPKGLNYIIFVNPVRDPESYLTYKKINK